MVINYIWQLMYCFNGGSMLKKVLSLVFVLVVLSSNVLPVMAVSSEQTTACSCKSCSNLENNNIAFVEVNGLEKNLFIEKATKDKKVKSLMDELESKGFVKKDIKVYKVPINSKDGLTSNILVLEMTFKSEKGEEKSLTYAYNPKTDESVVILGLWSCAVCAAVIVGGGFGCAGVCIVGGVLTFGVACIACIVAAGTVALCPCYDCCCATTGNGACCNSYQNLCT